LAQGGIEGIGDGLRPSGCEILTTVRGILSRGSCRGVGMALGWPVFG
jgi:hypothetical protein